MDLICTACGTCGDQKQVTPGSTMIEIVLWLCAIVPGVIYTLWRTSARETRCAACGGATLVPTSSPVGQRLLAEHPAAPPSPRAPARTRPRPLGRPFLLLSLAEVVVGLAMLTSAKSGGQELAIGAGLLLLGIGVPVALKITGR